MVIEWIDLPIRRTGWTSEELETFMAGEGFSGMPLSPERIEEMREELRRQLRERDDARARGVTDAEIDEAEKG